MGEGAENELKYASLATAGYSDGNKQPAKDGDDTATPQGHQQLYLKMKSQSSVRGKSFHSRHVLPQRDWLRACYYMGYDPNLMPRASLKLSERPMRRWYRPPGCNVCGSIPKTQPRAFSSSAYLVIWGVLFTQATFEATAEKKCCSGDFV
mmetsp:Transcript_44071/g.93824  ORF Transcript_44071/g.93824 Transcript_44071/m.93824 type:complete len:150 (-) Transcript_44071:675-1124(-)